MFCKKCGREVPDGSKFCTYCGENLENTTVIFNSVNNVNGPKAHTGRSPRSRGIALVLACLGLFVINGIHRFYVGKIGTGILWLLTGGCFGVGTIIDIIMIATGTFTDIDGLPLTDWNFDA